VESLRQAWVRQDLAGPWKLMDPQGHVPYLFMFLFMLSESYFPYFGFHVGKESLSKVVTGV